MADTKVKFSFEGEPTEYALELDFNELADAGALCTHDLGVVMAAIRQVLMAAAWLAEEEPVAAGTGDGEQTG
jgi:hypothetical protein